MKKDALEKLGYKLVTNDNKDVTKGWKTISKHYVRVDPEESNYEHIDVSVDIFDGTINADVSGFNCNPYESKYEPFIFNYNEIKAINQIIDECEKQLRA